MVYGNTTSPRLSILSKIAEHVADLKTRKKLQVTTRNKSQCRSSFLSGRTVQTQNEKKASEGRGFARESEKTSTGEPTPKKIEQTSKFTLFFSWRLLWVFSLLLHDRKCRTVRLFFNLIKLNSKNIKNNSPPNAASPRKTGPKTIIMAKTSKLYYIKYNIIN